MALYLVTGAAGFIGSVLAEHLLRSAHQVDGIDNLNDAYDLRLKQWRLARLQGTRGFAFTALDICDRVAMAEMWEHKRFDAVLNLAARAGVRPSVQNPRDYFNTNVLGTLNVLELCRRHGVRKFVQASTSSLYGGHNPRPFREDADLSRPLSPYAASKGAAELLCHSYHALYGIDVSVLRYFTVFGPAGRPDMSVFRFVQRVAEELPVVVYGDGTQERDFTYVEDVVRGTIAGLRPLGFEVINLGSDRPVRLLEILAKVEELVGKKARLDWRPEAPGDVRATWASIEKASKLLGWEPQVPLDVGLEATVAWYLRERDWACKVATSD